MVFNISDYKYIPCFKTKDGEIKSYTNIDSSIKKNILPLVELTRGRKSKTDQVGYVKKRTDKFKEMFEDNYFILDITSQEKQINEELLDLIDVENGFKNWCDFTKKLKAEGHNIVPVAHISTDEGFWDEIKLQINNLLSEFGFIAIRIFIKDVDNINFIKKISDEFNEKLNDILLIIDCEYVQANNYNLNTNNVNVILDEAKKSGYENISVISTSYPRNIVQSVGDQKRGSIECYEKHLFQGIRRDLNFKSLIYGDYASIHPFVYDDVPRRPIPKVEITNGDYYIYYRDNHPQTSIAYFNLSHIASNDPNFNGIPKCWGKEMIEDGSRGNVFARNATNWISVRMNIYITVKFNEL